MKAAHCTRYGPPEVLKLVEVDKPVPRAIIHSTPIPTLTAPRSTLHSPLSTLHSPH